MQCAICDATISDSVQCSACKKNIGYGCANITEQGYRKLGPERRAAWKCHTCKREVSPARTKPTDLDTIMNELRDMKKHILSIPRLVQDIEVIKSEMTEVRDSCNFACAKLDECFSRLSEVERKVSELGALQEKVQVLNSEVSFLKSELARGDQSHRMNNVEIKGVPFKKNENLFAIFGDICTTVNYQVDKMNVDYISRVPIHNSKEKLIIVSFTNRYIKEDFVASARLKKTMTAEEIGFQGSKQSVYINDHLTPENKKLLTKAKTTLKQKGYMYIWVKYCKIHARKDDNSKVMIINNERDLNKCL